MKRITFLTFFLSMICLNNKAMASLATTSQCQDLQSELAQLTDLIQNKMEIPFEGEKHTLNELTKMYHATFPEEALAVKVQDFIKSPMTTDQAMANYNALASGIGRISARLTKNPIP